MQLIPHDSPHKTHRIVALVVCGVVAVAAAVICFLKYGASVQAVTYLAVVMLLEYAAVSDLRSRTVPTWIIVTMLLLWALTSWLMPASSDPGAIGSILYGRTSGAFTAVVVDGIVSALIVGGGLFALTMVVESRTGRTSFGGGDIKLLFATSLYLGLPASLTMLLIACIIAVVLTLCVRKVAPDGFAGVNVDEPFVKMTIPFAPAIAIASIASLLFGPFTLF